MREKEEKERTVGEEKVVVKEAGAGEKAIGEEAIGKEAAGEKAMRHRAARKRLEEMNLLDNFLFGSVVTYPGIGDRFVRILLKTIFGRDFRHLSVTAQKVYYGADSDLHGARLDVYTEPEAEEDFQEQAAVYDIEPDREGSAAAIRALPRRMRFYHAKIAVKNLRAGAGYDELKNVIIIMLVPYDPFGMDRMVYTVKNKCVELPDMPYEDGASTLFLYAKGTKGVPNEAVRQLLHYMEDSIYENAVNEELREIHGMVETVKGDAETMLVHLRMMEELNRNRKEAREEGLAEGLAEGRAEGELYRLMVQVCRKMKQNQTLEKIAEDLAEEMAVVEPIYETAQGFAPEYDADAAFDAYRENQ